MVAGNAMDILKMFKQENEQLTKKIEVLTRELDRANGFHESAAGKLFNSEQKCKQLKAQVERFQNKWDEETNSRIRFQCRNERLRAFLKKLQPMVCVMLKNMIAEALEETPAQSLLLHNAEVVEKIVTDCGMSLEDAKGKYNPSLSTGFLVAKANKLRKQALENKS